jgi:hypothetical protein
VRGKLLRWNVGAKQVPPKQLASHLGILEIRRLVSTTTIMGEAIRSRLHVVCDED